MKQFGATLGSFFNRIIYLLNILNYVVCDALCMLDAVTDLSKMLNKTSLRSNIARRERKDRMWFFKNHSLVILGALTVPIALVLTLLVQVLYKNNFVYTYMILQGIIYIPLFALPKHSDSYFDLFDEKDSSTIWHWRYGCLFLVLADAALGAVSLYFLVNCSH